jgi:hypothetical protein
VPVVLGVTVLGAAVAAVAATSGCGEDAPVHDASIDAPLDAAPDTPIV